MIPVLIYIIASFFSMNMGAPSFAGSFSTAVGSRVLNKWKGGLFFVLFALLGSVLLGSAVSKTLGKGLIPSDQITTNAVTIILTAATLSLFVANMMHIPQSTSLSTIAAICGVGIYHHSVAWGKIGYLIMYWVLSTIISFILIYGATHYIYPPRRRNFWIYEKIANNQILLKWIVIVTSCYKGFAQGTNNVANAVGPLSAAGLIETHFGLFFFGILFGIGAFVFTGPLKTSSEKIIPLGLLTATVINFVSGTITIIASKLGIPLPTVIVYTVAIFAISSIKDGVGVTLENPVTRKTFFTWCINPTITLVVSLGLSMIFLSK